MSRRQPNLKPNAAVIMEKRYQWKDGKGGVTETPADSIFRVVSNVASVNGLYGANKQSVDDAIFDHYPMKTAKRQYDYLSLDDSSGVMLDGSLVDEMTAAYDEMVTNLDFLPNSPTWTGAGTPLGQLAACFVLPVEDDLGTGRASIFETLKVAALIQQTGGGNGFSFGRLRPNGALVNRSMGRASGPVGFMQVYDAAFGQIAQGGSRRGANMGVMPITHPDVMAFIRAKVVEGQVENFNISVAITDEFMEAVDKDADFELRWGLIGSTDDPVDYEIKRTVRARDLFQEITESAWVIGDPGILYIDAANRTNPVPARYVLEATNPCFHPDTMIETVHGPKRIADITEPTEVLTKGPSGAIEVRKASAAFITARDAQTVVVQLSNGRSLTVTPNHRIMLIDGTYVEAQSLRPGDRIEALCQFRRGSAYVGVKLASQPNRAYRMKHQVIFEGVHGRIPEGYDINHVDRDTHHNDIDNFELLTHSEHARLTRSQVPNNHQVINPATGRFVSGPDSRGGKKTIRYLPDDLLSSWTNQPRVVAVDPGPVADVYDITVDETHNVIADFVVAHNCGEQWLGPYENCCLGSINLANFTSWEGEFDWGRFGYTVRLATDFLDDVVDANQYVPAVPELESAAQGGRRIGLGLMGLADAMAKLGVRYGSADGEDFASQVTEFARYHTMLRSTERARERGPFGWIEDSIYDPEQMQFHGPGGSFLVPDDKSHTGQDMHVTLWSPPTPMVVHERDFGRPALDWSIVVEGIERDGIRNSCQFTFAPTGTISNVAGTEGSGCEPFFALAFDRFVTQEEQRFTLSYASDLFNEALVRAGLDENEIREISARVVANSGSCQGVEGVPDSIQYAFPVAADVTAAGHVRMQAVLQRFVDNSISKTINLPKQATVEDVQDAYKLAYELGCKGITVYRQGSREIEVLTTGKKDEVIEVATADWPVIRPMSIPPYAEEDGIDAKIFPVRTAFGKVQVMITEHADYPGRPFDVRLQLGKTGADKNADVEALGRMLSTSLRAGVGVDYIVEQLVDIGGHTVSGFGPAKVKSVADAVAKLLKRRYLADEALEAPVTSVPVSIAYTATSAAPVADPSRVCPKCHNASLVMESGCAHCDIRLGGCGSYEGCE